jgi:hypothetical protein
VLALKQCQLDEEVATCNAYPADRYAFPSNQRLYHENSFHITFQGLRTGQPIQVDDHDTLTLTATLSITTTLTAGWVEGRL